MIFPRCNVKNGIHPHRRVLEAVFDGIWIDYKTLLDILAETTDTEQQNPQR